MPRITKPATTTPAADAATTETPVPTSTPAPKATKPRKPAPAPTPVETDEPTFNVGGTALVASALTVGMMGVAKAGDLFIPPASHPRHDPRTMQPRSPEFVADIHARGIDTPVLVFVLDGRVEVKDGRGRVITVRDGNADAPVPFRVVAAPADALSARLEAMRANLSRTEVDPLTKAALAEEALAAGLAPEAVAAAMAMPLSSVKAYIRVARDGDEKTKSLLRDEVIDPSTALRLSQQPQEVRDAVHADIDAALQQPAADEKPADEKPATTGKGTPKADKPAPKKKVTRREVESRIDAHKGREAKDRSGHNRPASKPAATPETVAAINGRAEAMRAKALALRTTTKDEGQRAFLLGISEALAALFDPQFIVGDAHPFTATCNAVLQRAKR